MGSQRSRWRLVTLATLLALVMGSAMAGSSLAGPGRGRSHVCISVHGVVIEQRGDATCFSDATSEARASGKGSHAVATNDSVASASGRESEALAENESKAIASGSNSLARAVDRSEATANGDESFAEAILDATAIATGFSSSAHASTGSTAIATGDCDATADGGATDTCTGP